MLPQIKWTSIIHGALSSLSRSEFYLDAGGGAEEGQASLLDGVEVMDSGRPLGGDVALRLRERERSVFPAPALLIDEEKEKS